MYKQNDNQRLINIENIIEAGDISIVTCMSLFITLNLNPWQLPYFGDQSSGYIRNVYIL